MPLDFGGFLHISGLSLQLGEGGTDSNWNHPRRCVGGNSIAGKILQFIVFKLYGRKFYFSHIWEEILQ